MQLVEIIQAEPEDWSHASQKEYFFYELAVEFYFSSLGHVGDFCGSKPWTLRHNKGVVISAA